LRDRDSIGFDLRNSRLVLGPGFSVEPGDPARLGGPVACSHTVAQRCSSTLCSFHAVDLPNSQP
jgi:hypothetical protein